MVTAAAAAAAKLQADFGQAFADSSTAGELNCLELCLHTRLSLLLSAPKFHFHLHCHKLYLHCVYLFVCLCRHFFLFHFSFSSCTVLSLTFLPLSLTVVDIGNLGHCLAVSVSHCPLHCLSSLFVCLPYAGDTALICDISLALFIIITPLSHSDKLASVAGAPDLCLSLSLSELQIAKTPRSIGFPNLIPATATTTTAEAAGVFSPWSRLSPRVKWMDD